MSPIKRTFLDGKKKIDKSVEPVDCAPRLDTPDKPTLQYYTDGMLAQVRDAFAKDYALFSQFWG